MVLFMGEYQRKWFEYGEMLQGVYMGSVATLTMLKSIIKVNRVVV